VYSEFDIRKEIERIEGSELTPISKARELVKLSKNIRVYARRMNRGAGILHEDDDHEGAERIQQTLNCLKRLQEETRLAAFRVLKDKPQALGFEAVPEREAYPLKWLESKEKIQASLG